MLNLKGILFALDVFLTCHLHVAMVTKSHTHRGLINTCSDHIDCFQAREGKEKYTFLWNTSVLTNSGTVSCYHSTN